ncbi:methyl-accepting chemotaxis protein, partial [Brevundimonas sp. Root1279]|uniref:methyl-accepting chemotaxis protein n=1 Tax=Brevundimonas sp. Root1279 TaxID=1736443 RepID=UPI00138F013B
MKLSDMPIGRKLAVAFAAVLVAIAAMGGVVFYKLDALNKAGEARSEANRDVRTLATLDLKLARQENSYRGFLVSNDPYYLERLKAHQTDFKAALDELRKDAPQEDQARVDQVEAAIDVWHEKVVVAGTALAANPATRDQAVAMIGQSGAADEYIGAVEEPLEAIKADTMKRLDATREAQASTASAAMIAVFIGLAAAILIALGAGWVLTRGINGPVGNMIAYMRRLIGGDTSFEVPCVARKDEFGEMGRAIIAFRDAAIEKVRLENEAVAARAAADAERARNEAEKAREAEEDRVAITALGEGLAAMAGGNLTHRFTAEVAPKAARLKEDFNRAIVQLQEAMGVVVTNVSAIRSG